MIFKKMKQTTENVLMVKPANFRSNEETLANNYYQKRDTPFQSMESSAILEFTNFVAKLREHGIHVLVCEQEDGIDTPDAHFPNNWISFHQNGNIIVYPMFAENRRKERRKSIINTIINTGFSSTKTIDYSFYESTNQFLEGTGSLVLDRTNRIAYAAISDRTDITLFELFCQEHNFKSVPFQANQTVSDKRVPIYHTNVMMCVAETFAVICLDSIDNHEERKTVIHSLEQSGKKIITITEKQVESFAGNMLQLRNQKGQRFLVMSTQAFQSLNKSQLNAIENECEIIHSPINTIETYGGGSARCMIAEIFLPKTN